GRDNHFIRSERLDVVRLKHSVVENLDLKLGQLPFEPVEIVDDLLPARLQSGEAELATKLVGGFGKRHVMTAFGGNAGRFETGNAAPNDKYFLRLGCRREAIAAPFEFAARGWVDKA